MLIIYFETIDSQNKTAIKIKIRPSISVLSRIKIVIE